MKTEETKSVAVPDIEGLVAMGKELQAMALELTVQSDEELVVADQLKGQIKAKINTFLPGLEEKCQEAHGLHKFMTDLRGAAVKPYYDALNEVNRLMGAYQFQRAEKIRKENERRAAEAQRKADQQRADEIAEAKKRKDKEALENLKNAPPPVPVMTAVPKPTAAPKLANSSFRDAGYGYRIETLDLVPRKYLKADDDKIAGVVKALGAECDIPGIVVFKKAPTVTSR